MSAKIRERKLGYRLSADDRSTVGRPMDELSLRELV
jgi:hypothetical protein